MDVLASKKPSPATAGEGGKRIGGKRLSVPLGLGLVLKHSAPFILAAVGANVVWQAGSAAVGAGNQRGGSQVVMCAAAVAAAL